MSAAPNLFLVGAPKCGTTAWVSYLSTHPDIFFSNPKEPEYFGTDFPNWGIKDESEYLRCFAGAKGESIIGEASVRYLYSTEAAANIHRFNPNSRILILVRRQEDYLPSLHNQNLYNGDEVIEDFEDAWRLSTQRVPPRSCREPRFLDYMSQGRFHEQVARYVGAFGKDRVRVLHFDDWTISPRETHDGILEFLAVERDDRSSFPTINEATRHRIQLLGRFTQSPPRWAIRASAAVKHLTGLERPPFIDSIRSLNRSKGYRTAGISERLKEEIRSFYAEDNRLLDPFIWRPSH